MHCFPCTSTHILCAHLVQGGVLHRRQQPSSLLQAALQSGAEMSLSCRQVLGVTQALPKHAPQMELSLCLAAVCRSPQVGCCLQAQLSGVIKIGQPRIQQGLRFR